MNREALKEMGLTDEQIDSVMKAHGTAINTTKEQLETAEAERDSLKEQITERDTQLAELGKKAKGNEELTAEINRLKEENTTATTELQQKLDRQAFDFSLDKALAAEKVRNPKAVKALLDLEKIKLDGDKLLGFDDQITALKESDAYQFETEEKAPPNTPNIVVGGNPNGSTGGPVTKQQIMQEKDNIKRQELIKQNSHLFK